MLHLHFLQKLKEKKNLITSLSIHFFLILFTLQNYELNKKVTLNKYNKIDVQIYSSSKNQISEKNSNDNINVLNKKILKGSNSSSKPLEKKDISKAKNIKKQPITKETAKKSQSREETKKFEKYLKELDKHEASKEIIKKKNIEKTNNINSVDNNKEMIKNTEVLESYKDYLKKTIQNEASKNYPRISMRKKEEGKVEVIFSLFHSGEIKNIDIGSSTTAPKRIIESLINVLQNKITKFDENEILKKTNTFSIIIVYKLE